MSDLDPSAPNTIPERYRQVAVSDRIPGPDPSAVREHLIGREVYHRTRFIVADHRPGTSLIEVDTEPGDGLFLVVTDARVVASPDECIRVHAPEVDVGIPTALAAAAPAGRRTGAVIVEGLYGHVNFILNPDPLVIDVHDVLDPKPSKLLDQVRRVLEVAEDLPPIEIRPRITDVEDLLAEERPDPPAEVLVPCRGSGADSTSMTVHYLDERPELSDWVLLGCERSQRIHRWFYGVDAELVDTCPRRSLPADATGSSTLSRCCMLQEGIGTRAGTLEVPWGASLAEVREALDRLVAAAISEGRFSWQRT